MKLVHTAVVFGMVLVLVLCVNSTSHSQSGQRNGVQEVETRTFDYATLTTASNREANNIEFILTWNDGFQDVIGRSTRSLLDAQRQLNNLLGGGNDSRTNLSVLLDTLGSEGWELKITEGDGSNNTRIFVKSS